VTDDVRPISPGLLESVAASAAGMSPVDHPRADIKTHHARGERSVVEYRFDGGVRVVAKRYPQPGQARASYDALRILWERGFGSGSRHRVAEPLGCFADWRVVLTRAAPGKRLAALAARPGRWEEGLHAAGGWLAKFHALPVDLGPREDVALGAFRLARRSARAGAHHPELEGFLVQLIEELEARVGSAPASRSRRPTHGRYHAGHVFVAPETVTVIDLDGVALADPAKDVGEFLHRLRTQGRPARLDDAAAMRAALVFIQGYTATAGAVPDGLLYHWSYSILSGLLRLLQLGDAKWEQRLAFYRAEFADVPRRVRALSGVP
jgi:hypothetical protein